VGITVAKAMAKVGKVLSIAVKPMARRALGIAMRGMANTMVMSHDRPQVQQWDVM